MTVALQCCAGRFVLPALDAAMSVRAAKRAFRRAYADLADVHLAAYAVSHKGVLVADDTATLRSIGVADGDTLFLVHRSDLPVDTTAVHE